MPSIFDADPDKLLRGLISEKVCAAINALPVKNAEAMAKATHAVLRELCTEIGANPDIETMIKGPDESHLYMSGTPGIWIVAWESGPYQWAIGTSMAIVTECQKLAEPYYSFDLCFYPGED
jgi:hypothetical protein